VIRLVFAIGLLLIIMSMALSYLSGPMSVLKRIGAVKLARWAAGVRFIDDPKNIFVRLLTCPALRAGPDASQEQDGPAPTATWSAATPLQPGR